MLRRTALLILAATLVIPAAATAQVPRAANGQACTIVGTAAADTLRGTKGNDVICGLGGNDRMLGGTGSDTLDGGAGADRLSGEGGTDLLLGGLAVDTLDGGAAADRIVGGDGNDAVTAGTGDVCAAPGGDSMTGTCTADTAGPVISAVSVAAQVAAGSLLTVTWRLADATGVGILEGGPASWLQIGGAPGWLTWCGFQIPATRLSGDALDGTYQATCAIPAGVPNGEYGLWIGAYDLAGTTTPADERATFRIGGGTDDTTAPVVTEVRLGGPVPGPGGTLILEWRAADPSGIDYVLPWVFGPNGLLVSQPSGAQWFGMGSDPVRLTGDGTDGTYRQSLPASAELVPGVYSVWFSGRDVPGNRFYDGGPGGTGYLTFTVPG